MNNVLLKFIFHITLWIFSGCHFSFVAIGKPEPLKHQLSGYWSRIISNGGGIMDDHPLYHPYLQKAFYQTKNRKQQGSRNSEQRTYMFLKVTQKHVRSNDRCFS